jgi:hypothetical protein
MIDAGVREYLAEAILNRLRKTILRIVTTAGDKGIARSALMQRQAVSSAKSKGDFESAIKWLEMADQIETKISSGAGRPGARYFARKEAA